MHRFWLWFALIASSCPVVGHAAAPACAVPLFVVPIDDLDAVVHRCNDAFRGEPRKALGSLQSLVQGWTCVASIDRIGPLRDRFECLAQHTDSLPASGPLLGWRDFDLAHCAVARQTLEWAARRGSGEAYFELYEIGLGAHWHSVAGGDCAPDIAAAANYLEAAAALKVPRAETELAVAMMAHIDAAAYRALDDPFAPGRLLMAQNLGGASRYATRADALALLESAAHAGYPGTLAILSEALAAGFWGPAREEALAWAAINAARYEADPEHDLFPNLYASASEASRKRACARIGEITRQDINFRYVPGEIVNPLMLQCVDSAAIVHDVKCLDDAAFASIERTIEPLVAETPECTDWTIATAGYNLEPPGAAPVESLEPLPKVGFAD